MRSREEIESLVRQKNENLSNTQKSVIYNLTKRAGDRFATIKPQVVEQEYPDMDVEGHKQHLLENFDEVLQSIYESYDFEDHLPTSKEISAKIDEATKARKEGTKRSDVLRIAKETRLMENARGEGEFTLDGLPLKLREDCEKRMDEAIQQAEQTETEEQEISEPTEERTKITGQELGKETLEEQKDTAAKQTAMERLNALRTRVKEGEKEQ